LKTTHNLKIGTLSMTRMKNNLKKQY